MSKKEICANSQTIGVYAMGLFGIEIKKVVYYMGDDYVLFTDCKGDAHRARIHYETNGAYFNFMGHRVRMSECIRV